MFILAYSDWDVWDEIYGVFTTRELAVKHKTKLLRQNKMRVWKDHNVLELYDGCFFVIELELDKGVAGPGLKKENFILSI